MRINKYLLYTILMLITIGFTIGKQCWNAVFYSKTFGTLKEYETFVSNNGRRRNVSYIPIVEFKLGDNNYTFYGSSNLHEVYSDGSTVPVLYNPKNPTDAYVYNVYGYWSHSLFIVIPVWVVLSSLLLAVGFVPKIIVINKKTMNAYFKRRLFNQTS